MRREWPCTAAELEREQEWLARAKPPPWSFAEGTVVAGLLRLLPARAERTRSGGRPSVGGRRDRGGGRGRPRIGRRALRARAARPPEDRLLEAALRALRHPPDAVLVDATGRDHPRGAGLALHLGAVLDLPTVGVAHRPLLAAAPLRGWAEAGGRPVDRWPTPRGGASQQARWLMLPRDLGRLAKPIAKYRSGREAVVGGADRPRRCESPRRTG